MNTTLRAVFVAGVLVLMSNAGHAMRCNGQIVDEGDSAASVIAKCGEPSSSWSNTEFTAPDSATYSRDDGTDCAVRQVNGKVTGIDCNRR